MKTTIIENWNNYLDSLREDSKDIYYTEEYVKLYADAESCGQCIICEDEKNILLMPFIRRSIGGFYDFETAYGYGGPITNSNDRIWIKDAFEKMCDCFKRQKYVCGFIRFHPLLNNAKYCDGVISVIKDRKTISVKTDQEEDEIWKTQISSKNRNMIRKAEKKGLEYRAEYDFRSLDEFKRLYHSTMTRLHAEKFYFFSAEYYKTYIHALKGRSFLGTARLGGKLIGAALFMHSRDYGHYHLAGSDPAYSSLGINNFLLWNTIKEYRRIGIKEFHLGGGTGSSEDDPLFKFKSSFSCYKKDFYIGKCIFDEGAYQNICSVWEKENPSLIQSFGDRLLKYRYLEE